MENKLPDVLGFPLALSFTVQFVGWLLAARFKTGRHYDLFGAATFFAVVLSLPTPAQSCALMVIVWCCRLGTFLTYRSARHGEDPRFADFLHNPAKFAVAWFLQGVWVVVCLLPVILRAHRPAAPSLPTASAASSASTFLFLAGFALEVTADAQKWAFKSNPANKNKQIRSGVWSWVKYPNYAGEIILWLGIALSATADGVDNPTELALSFLSPAFVAFLLIFVSGIPLQEAAAARATAIGPDSEDRRRHDIDTRAKLIPHVY